MTFEITERLVESTLYYVTLYGKSIVPNEPKYTTHYDVVRVVDRKVIKSFTDLLEALYYKKELEKLLGENPNT